MPKGGKRKDKEAQEPPHDPDWEKAVEGGLWTRPPSALPDAYQWPTWGALRERILTSCSRIEVNQQQDVRDTFPAEIVKLAPPYLEVLSLKSNINITKVVISPINACPSLRSLHLDGCPKLEYVLVQSASLENVSLTICKALKKIVLHCSSLQTVDLRESLALESVMIWSEVLDDLDIKECKNLKQVDLHCPALAFPRLGKFAKVTRVASAAHAPVHAIVAEDYSIRDDARDKEREMHKATAGGNVYGRLDMLRWS
ncbi:unnamed protein product [Pedinophyceae sp. YPF-701]|nr:unnamed protein product [Pedinophyceae sp. YPF-701]